MLSLSYRQLGMQIINVVTVQAVDRPAAVAVAIVFEALRSPAASSTREDSCGRLRVGLVEPNDLNSGGYWGWSSASGELCRG